MMSLKAKPLPSMDMNYFKIRPKKSLPKSYIIPNGFHGGLEFKLTWKLILISLSI